MKCVLYKWYLYFPVILLPAQGRIELKLNMQEEVP